MKRLNNLYDKIIHPRNLVLADNKARARKRGRKEIKRHDKQRGCNILLLHNQLAELNFTTSDYTTFPVLEPKERIVYKLPYYPDRIVHHAILNILESVFVSRFTSNTYSCIKGRGVHAMSHDIKTALRNVNGTMYCLKMDITKFYPSIDHDILKAMLRRIIKDNRLLGLLDDIVISADGTPIGNYISQYFANFYLNGFDHWIKQDMGVKHYFRYADDMVILAPNKDYLQKLLADIKQYLANELKLTLNRKYQVFPVSSRGINVVGYVHYHTHTYLRKSIKQNMARNRNNPVSAASYWGWAKHCDSRHLIKKLKLHDCIQRLRNKGRIKRTIGGKTKNRQSIQYQSKGIGIRDKAKQSNQRQLSLFAN